MKRRVLVISTATERIPPVTWFAVGAMSRYLGPAFAVLLFPAVGVLGIAWLRIATAAAAFAPWTKPWRVIIKADRDTRVLLVGLGACFAFMNTAFYLALDRLPISLVASIEFVGTIGVAVYGLRSTRNIAALALAAVGVILLIDVTWASDPLGLFWAVLNGAFFVCYIVLGHKISEAGASQGVERIGAAMFIAFLFVIPIGVWDAVTVLSNPVLLFAGIGVGICSSVIPYICDQFAMSQLPRASFALLLALLPAIATVIGVIVLRQFPTVQDVMGVLLVMAGVALHVPSSSETQCQDER